MSNRKIKCINEDDFIEADKFLSDNFSSPTHWKDWNLVISKHFNTEFFYYGCYENKILTGICPVHRIKKKIRHRLISGPKEYLIPYGGWIFSEKTVVNQGSFLIKKNENFEAFTLPQVNEFNTEYSGIKVLKNYKTAIIDLKQSEDEIWNKLDQKRRNMIRKAVKNKVIITNMNKVNLEEFYKFYYDANKQYRLSNLPFEYFYDLSYSAKNIKIDILEARFENEIMGYNVIISDKNYSIYWLGIRKKETINNGFFDLLQWESIKKAKSGNCKYYDLCYVEKERLPNIYKFKTDYSKVEYDVLNLNIKSIFYSIINKIQKF